MKKLLILYFLITLNFSLAAQNLQWAKSIGSTKADRARSIALDANGNQYITGYFEGTVDFDPGLNVQNLISANNQTSDAYILKLDPQGNFLWVKQIGGSFNQQGTSIALDSKGDVYIVGLYSWTIDFDPGPGTYTMTNPVFNEYNTFVLKLDGSGNFIWAKQCYGNTAKTDTQIKIDSNDNLYIAGCFTSLVDFDPGPSTFQLFASGDVDVFITKWDSNGNFLWAKQWGNNVFNADIFRSFDIDANANVYLVANFQDTIDLDPGPALQYAITNNSIAAYSFVCKLNSTGNFAWAKVLEGDYNLTGYKNEGYSSIYVEPSGSLYLSGAFQGTVDCDPGPAINTLSTTGLIAILTKLDTQGNFLWNKEFPGSIDIMYYTTQVTGDTQGGLYFSGSFMGTIDFDPGTSIHLLSAYGFNDVFCCKYNSSGDFIWAAQIGGTANEFVYDAVCDALGNIYLVGDYYSTCDFDPGPSSYNSTSNGLTDIYVQKMNTSVFVGLDDENDETPYFNFWPNPSNGNIHIRSSRTTKIILSNISGEIVNEFLINPNQLTELKELPKGIYFLNCETSAYTFVKKILVF
jgi:hypothetical protein